MKPCTTKIPFSKHNKLHQVLLVLAFSLIILTILPQYHPSILNPFRYVIPPLSSSETMPRPSTSLPPVTNETEKSSIEAETSGNCDIFVGDWVPDPDAPRYTNITCRNIQEHQNCLKYGKPNTDFLKWRWKPEGCELPRIDPHRFLELVRGKSMAFIGDSLARNQMQSLMCLLSRVDNPKDISPTKDEDNKVMFYKNYNFTISVIWSAFLVRTKAPEDIMIPHAMWTLYLDEVDEDWVSQIANFDYIIMSDGNWFARPAVFYEKGQIVGCSFCQKPNVPDLTVRYSNRKAFRTAFSAINRVEGFKGMVFLRTLSSDHFENGEWDTGGDCVRTTPYRKNQTSLGELVTDLYEAQIEEFRKARMEGSTKGLKFKVIDPTQAMLLRPDGHPSRYGHWPQPNVTFRNDCVHWCLPGPVDLWNDFLFHMMTM